MKSSESIIKNVVIAMQISGIHQLTEGGMYWALFKQGMDTDAATGAVKYAIDANILKRTGHVLALSHGKEDSDRAQSVCNS